MKVSVTVVPGAKTSRVEPDAHGGLRVWVTEPAREGRANAALVDILAAHFQVSRSCVRILRGGTGRRKLVEVR